MSHDRKKKAHLVDPVNRIIMLGASNLTLSYNLITQLIQQRCGRPSDVLIAAGHGRSYGHYSQVLVRGLPGIISCDLWSRLDSTKNLPTYAFMTDIGNDIPYGHSPDKLLEWITWCVERLLGVDAHIVMTNIPIALIKSLPEWHFRLIRNIFFPFSYLSRTDLFDHASFVHSGLEEIASKMKFEIYELEPDWFGPDIIHVPYWKRKALYQSIIERFPVNTGNSTSNKSLHLSRWRKRPRFAYKKVMGRDICHSQPSSQLVDGTTISLY